MHRSYSYSWAPTPRRPGAMAAASAASSTEVDTLDMLECEWRLVRRQLANREQTALQKLSMISTLCLDHSEVRDALLSFGLADNDKHLRHLAWDAIHDLTAPGPAPVLRAMVSCKRASRCVKAATLGPVCQDLLHDVLRDLRDISAIRILLGMEPHNRMDAPAYGKHVEAVLENPDDDAAMAEIYMGYHSFMAATCPKLRFLSNTEVRRVLDKSRLRPPKLPKALRPRAAGTPPDPSGGHDDDGAADDDGGGDATYVTVPDPIGWGRQVDAPHVWAPPGLLAPWPWGPGPPWLMQHPGPA